MFNYTPMSEEQAMRERFELLNDGEYHATIKSATLKNSQSGNPMFEVYLDVYNEIGKPHALKDYLVFTNKMMWKVRHCAEATNLIKEYEDQKFAPELILNKNIKVLLSKQEGNIIPDDKLKGKPSGSRYPDKNVVLDYIKDDGSTFVPDSDIPF